MLYCVTVMAASERCQRCFQPVTAAVARCPHCGHPISGNARRLSLWIGVGGVGAILFLVLLMWLVVYNEDVEKAPVLFDSQSPRPAEALPDTSKQPEKPAQPEKEKKPPLNQ